MRSWFNRQAPERRRQRGLKSAVRPRAPSVDRTLRDLFGGGTGRGLIPPDAMIRTSLSRLRAACRQEYSQSDWARAVVMSARNRIIGSAGLMLRLPDQFREVETAWALHSAAGAFDVSGQLSRAECEQLVVSQCYIDGEALFRLRDGGQVESVDPARMSVDVQHEREAGGAVVVMGVEFDKDTRRPLAYHVDQVSYDRGSYFLSYSRRSADRAQRWPAADCLHVFLREYAEQLRGRPYLATAVPRIRQLREYEAAELRSSTLVANKIGFIERSETGETLAGERAGEDGVAEIDVDAGGFLELGTGAKANVPEWGRPSDQFSEFQRANLLGMSAGTGTPYTELGGVREASFSSIRAESLAVREHWRAMQNVVRSQFTVPVFRAWLRDAIADGTVMVPMSRYREVLAAAEFVGRSWDHVQPREQAAAETERLSAGTVSRHELIRESGRDPREVDAERSADSMPGTPATSNGGDE